MTEDKFEFEEEFQKSLIKRSIEDSQWYIENVKYLKSDYFDSSVLAEINTIILDFYNKHGISPDYSVIKSVSKRINRRNIHESIIDELDVIEDEGINPSKLLFAEKSMVKFSTEQHYKNCLISAVDELEIGNIQGVEKCFDDALTYNYDTGGDGIIDMFGEDTYRDKYTNVALTKIPTLIPTLDEKTKGGGSKKELAMFLAPPYRGKSAGLIRIGTNALITGKNVIHVTLEMSTRKTAIRYDSAITGIPYDDIIKSKKQYQKKINEFKKLHKGNLIIAEYPARSLGIKELSEFVRSTERQKGWKTDLLIVDYVDEMKRKDMDNMSYAVGDVVARLRGLATELDILIWSASQTNRAGFSKDTLDMDNMADSWDKAKVSDIIIGMCQTKDEERNEKMRWVIIKNRDNKKYSSPIPMRTKFETMNFKEL